jgi:membrane protein required for colicin V production
MNWADYTILGVLGLSVLVGLWRGLISEVLALVIWIAAFWVAWSFGGEVAARFPPSVSLPSARMVLGYGACFVAVLVAGALLRFALHKLVAGTGLSGSDRMLGMVFGLARGVFLVTLVVMLMGFTPFPRDPWWHESRLLPGFRGAAAWLGARLPESVRHYLDFDPATITAAVPGALSRVVPAHVGSILAPARASTTAGH